MMFCLRSWFSPCSIALIVGIAVVGCGGGADDAPERGAVRGKVTFDGQPVEAGRIDFTPMDGTTGTMTGSEKCPTASTRAATGIFRFLI